MVGVTIKHKESGKVLSFSALKVVHEIEISIIYLDESNFDLAKIVNEVKAEKLEYTPELLIMYLDANKYEIVPERWKDGKND